MNPEILLSRLHGVRATGPASWRGNCPNGHTKARGTLAITQGEDGRILLMCFACHDTPAILGALGLELADLFPESIRDPSPEARQQAREAFKRNAWAAALRVLSREVAIVVCAAGDLRQGEPLEPDDHARLCLAMQRIDGAREVLA